MFIKSVLRKIVKNPGGTSLRSLLIVPFALQIFTVVGLVGYFSYKNGQKGINDVVSQLRKEITQRIETHLENYTAKVHLINQMTVDAIERGELSLDVSKRTNKTDRYLWQIMRQFNNVTWLSLGSEQGEYYGIYRNNKQQSLEIVVANSQTNYINNYYALDRQGNLTGATRITIKSKYDPRIRPWYIEAVKAKTAIWTPIYQGFDPDKSFAALSRSIKDPTGKLLGAIAIDVSLDKINQFLGQLEIGKTGRTFIIENSGLIVGTSTKKSIFRFDKQQQKYQRINAINSSDPIVRATAKYLKEEFSEYNNINKNVRLNFKYDRERYFVEILRYQDKFGLDWLIVVILPESDFTGKIEANNRITIALSALSLVIAIVFGYFTSNWIIEPILSLNNAAKSIAKNKWEERVKIERSDELGELARSFNSMAKQLQESFAILERQNNRMKDLNNSLREESLGRKIARAKLIEQNRNLEKIVARRTATLAESQRTLATLMSNLPGMAYRSTNDRKWKMIFVSRGCLALTGYNSEDLTNKQIIEYAELIHPEDRNNVWNRTQKCLENRQAFQLIYRLILPRSQLVKWVWEQGRGIYNRSGELIFIEGFIIDISDRIFIEQKLKDSNQNLQQTIAKLENTQAQLKIASQKSEAANLAKSLFLANMSHELRTPLNSIIGFAQLLNRDSSLQTSQQEKIKIINSSGEYLLSLINNILDISKIEAGKINLKEDICDLHSLLKAIEKMFLLKTKEKGINLFLERNTNIPQFIYTDENKLRQVLINLIGNAVKFTDRGRVKISVGISIAEEKTADTQILYFEILDTGPGIAPDEIEKIFIPFEQTSSGYASKQGTGLGLSLSQKYVELMGGEIAVQSTLGVGSCFKFKIPIRQSLAPINSSDRIKNKVIGLAPSQPEYKILIVDDIAENRQLLSELLTSVGFLVKEASNGIQAIETWQDWHPDLIWMDLRMPEMDGYEATRKIRAIAAEQSSNTIIIALTASALIDEREKILASGFDGYVFKPFQASAIWSTSIEHLDVQFIYQEEKNKTIETTKQDKDPPPDPLTAETFSDLPSEWLQEIEEAARQLKGKRVLESIAQIEPKHPQLAEQLRDLARDYQFKRIIERISQF